MEHDTKPMQNEESALAGFSKIYAESNPPWDIDKPQSAFVAVADQVVSPVLDAGCGTGGPSLFFAARGEQVTGIDFVEEAIRRARAKADERGLTVEFLVKDAMTLGDWDRRFASVIDSGLFHVYDGDERQRYVQGLARVLKRGGRLFLLSFNDDPEWPGGGVSRRELYEAFADGWEIESLELVGGEVNPAFEAEFPDAFADRKMWFAIIRREDSSR
ncbi:MAG: class I SAM-dependent methyltransferase [Pseudomonadota bacterium]